MTKFLPSSIKFLLYTNIRSSSGPACSLKQSGEREQVLDKSLVEIVLFDNNNMSSVCPLSAVSPYLPVPALTSGQSHIIANQLTSQLTQLIISPLSLFCLTDYCKVFRIAKCSQQCLIFESRPSKRKVTLAL